MKAIIKDKVYERVYKNGTIVRINVYSKAKLDRQQFMIKFIGAYLLITILMAVASFIGNTLLSTYSITEVVSASK